jgi:hypothetical protein
MYPQGNGPDNWTPYDQQPYQQGHPGPQFPGPGNPRPASSKTPLIIVGAVVGGFLLFCAAAILVVAVTPSDEEGDPAVAASAAATTTSAPTATPTSAPTPTSTGSPSSYDLEGDLERFKQGDCLIITGTDREVKPARCTDAGAMKVFLRLDGVDASRDDVCDAVEETTDILFIDDVGTSKDLVLCVGEAG